LKTATCVSMLAVRTWEIHKLNKNKTCQSHTDCILHGYLLLQIPGSGIVSLATSLQLLRCQSSAVNSKAHLFQQPYPDIMPEYSGS